MKERFLMNPKDIRNYKHLERLIRIVNKKLDVLRENDGVADRVTSSQSLFPYVDGHASVFAHTNSNAIRREEAELKRLEMLKKELESVPIMLDDPVDRIIFEKTLEGQSQTQIALALKVDQGTVSRRLKKICDCYS